MHVWIGELLVSYHCGILQSIGTSHWRPARDVYQHSSGKKKSHFTWSYTYFIIRPCISPSYWNILEQHQGERSTSSINNQNSRPPSVHCHLGAGPCSGKPFIGYLDSNTQVPARGSVVQFPTRRTIALLWTVGIGEDFAAFEYVLVIFWAVNSLTMRFR